MTLWIKVCANTSLEDALVAVEAGADAVGFVFAASPRQVTTAQAAAIASHLPPAIEKIGVFVDATAEDIYATVRACSLTGVQLHYEVSPELTASLRMRLGAGLRMLRTVRFNATAGQQMVAIALDPHVDAVLVDSYSAKAVGGTGTTFDWNEARKTLFQNAAEQKIIAAGGLNPDNIAQAIATLRPWGVDVASGVEASPGRKDHAKVREFVIRARTRI